MKRKLILLMMIVLVASVVSCRGQDEGSNQTGTISPTTPANETSGEAVTTQTVEVGDTERSPAEGAGASTETTETTGTSTPRP